MAPQRRDNGRSFTGCSQRRLLVLPWSLGKFVSEPQRKGIRAGQTYFFPGDVISSINWIGIFGLSQAGSVLISLDHTANSPQDKHPHALPGAWLFCLAAFRLSHCQNMGHAEIKGMKQLTGFSAFLLRSCSFPKLPGFCAKYLSYSLRTLLLAQKNEPEETLQKVPSFQQGWGWAYKEKSILQSYLL